MRFREQRQPKVFQFLSELLDLCLKYGVSIAHEDTQGAFIIEDFKKENLKWIGDALDNTTETEEPDEHIQLD